MLSRVNSPWWLAGEGDGFIAVMSVGLFGLGAMGGGTLANSSPPNSEDDEDESERRFACACAVLTSSGAVELDWGRLPTGDPPDVKPSSELCLLPPPRGSISEAAWMAAEAGESERHLRGTRGRTVCWVILARTGEFYKAKAKKKCREFPILGMNFKHMSSSLHNPVKSCNGEIF